MAYKIVVPHDYGQGADHALDWAAKLARNTGGSLVLLHVIQVPSPPIKKLPMIPELRPIEDPDMVRQKLAEVAAAHGVPAEVDVFETGDAGPGIVARSRELGADMVVMGISAPGRGGLVRAILGNVVDYVIWHASCPVVAVRLTDPA